MWNLNLIRSRIQTKRYPEKCLSSKLLINIPSKLQNQLKNSYFHIIDFPSTKIRWASPKVLKKKLIHIQSKSQKNNLSKQDKGSVFANQCKRVRTIFMMIMLNYKQNQSCNWKKPKKSPDPTRKPPSNRAPIFGRPPPHLSVNLSTTQHQIKIGSRPIYQIRPKNHWNLPKKKIISTIQFLLDQWNWPGPLMPL